MVSSVRLATARSVTRRSIAWGVALVVVLNVWTAYCEYVVRASRLNGSHFPVALVAPLSLLVLVVWPLLARIGRASWAPTGPERTVILLMGLLGASVPANGLTGFMLGIIATPYYYATPENKWATFQPYIPGWIVPPDRFHAMRWFFNGLPPGQSIPWNVWLVPLFWWGTFIAAIIALCLTLSIIMRKQWVEYERLSYPLVEAGLSLVAGDDDVAGRKPVLRSRLFWAGTALTLFIMCWNALGWLQPLLPQIPIRGSSISLFRGAPSLSTRWNFLTIGLSYFAPQQMLGSLLFGCLATSVESSVFARVGLTFGPAGDSWTNNDVGVGWQSFGAMVIFVVWGIWQARRHLGDVWRSARNGSDAGDEILSYRTTVVVLVVSGFYVWLWLHVAGMDYSFAFAFVVLTVMGYLALGRMIAEAGFVYQRLPISPQSATVYLLGVQGFSPGTMTAFAFSYSLVANGRGLFMPAIVQATRMGDVGASGGRREMRRVVGAIALAFALGLVVSVVLTLYYGYTYGAYNFRVYPFSGGNQEAFGHTIRKIENPFGPDPARMAMAGIGAAVMCVLVWLRYQFPGFPFHPIGFVFPFTYLTREAFMSFFVAWAVKSLMLRIGGVRLYRRTQPLFLGLAVGYCLGIVVSFAVDAVWFPGSGHMVHSW